MKLRKFLTKLTFLTLLIVVAPVSQVKAWEIAKIDEFVTNTENILKQAHEGDITNLMELLQKTEKIFQSERAVISCSVPANVLGMISGDFNGVLRLVRTCCSGTDTLICLGDYMGNNTLPHEYDYRRLMTLIFLLQLKLEHPDKVFLIKGVPEAGAMDENSYNELCFRYFPNYGQKIFLAIKNVYDQLPVAVNIDGRILCVHGGPPFILDMTDTLIGLGLVILKISIDQLNDKEICPLTENVIDGIPVPRESKRGILFDFEYDFTGVKEFLQENRMEMIVAGARPIEQGYEFPYYPKHDIVSISSSHWYGGGWRNDSSMMQINATYLCSFKVFSRTTPKSMRLTSK